MACDPEVVGRHILINLNPSGIASSGHNIPRNINVMPSFLDMKPNYSWFNITNN